jgi:hypothetical protein
MKNILLFCLYFSFIFSVSAAPTPISPVPPVSIPENIPFGKHVVTEALSSVCKGNIQIYGSGLRETSYVEFDFDYVESSSELANIVRLNKPTVWVQNPLEVVWIRSALIDNTGCERLIAYTSYRHVVKRDSKGRKTYVVPRYACNLYYEVAEQSFKIADAQSAMAISVDGQVFGLEVENGVIKIPSFITSNTEYWNMLQINRRDGSIVQYDGGGNRMRQTINALQPEYVNVQSLYRVEMQDGYAVRNTLAPRYGWNPIIEVTNAEKQYVTIDIQDSESKARPTYIRMYTLEQERTNTKPDWIEYAPENVDYYRETLEVPLNSGTYFIECEWPTYIQYDSSGGKG